MKKSEERDFEALNYGKQTKAKLTAKQYLVYSYLMSVSKWDSQSKEQHYYVYKNSFVINEVCKLLHITAPTWRSAIKKLKENYYIWDRDTYYIIDIPNSYAPLNIKLIRILIQFGAALSHGGHIVSVYSVLYKYWKYSIENGNRCEININQLKRLFGSGSNGALESITYKIMLAIFGQILQILDYEPVERTYKGNKYMAYIIKRVDLALPASWDNEDEIEPDNIDQILEALTNSLEERKNIA